MASEIPINERLTCNTRQACQMAGWGMTKLFELIKDGEVETRKIKGQRLIVVASLIKLLGLTNPSNPSEKN
jgi:hypothetical protein